MNVYYNKYLILISSDGREKKCFIMGRMGVSSVCQKSPDFQKTWYFRNHQREGMQHYETICQLGIGCSANVYLLRNRVSGELCAGKKILLPEIRGDESPKWSGDDLMKKEVWSVSINYLKGSILKSLAHPNIIPCSDCFVDDCSFFIIMEYMNGGDLSFLIDHFQKRGEYS